MNIGLIGSGGREHALCKKICESKLVNKVFCLPGNAGTASLATNINIDILNFKKVLKLIKFYKMSCVQYVRSKYSSNCKIFTWYFWIT